MRASGASRPIAIVIVGHGYPLSGVSPHRLVADKQNAPVPFWRTEAYRRRGATTIRSRCLPGASSGSAREARSRRALTGASRDQLLCAGQFTDRLGGVVSSRVRRCACTTRAALCSSRAPPPEYPPSSPVSLLYAGLYHTDSSSVKPRHHPEATTRPGTSGRTRSPCRTRCPRYANHCHSAPPATGLRSR